MHVPPLCYSQSSGEISKKAAKKAAAKAEKERKKAERGVVTQERGQKATAMTQAEEGDPLADKYGDAPRVQSSEITGRVWTDVLSLNPELKGQQVNQHGFIKALRLSCTKLSGSPRPNVLSS